MWLLSSVLLVFEKSDPSASVFPLEGQFESFLDHSLLEVVDDHVDQHSESGLPLATCVFYHLLKQILIDMAVVMVALHPSHRQRAHLL